MASNVRTSLVLLTAGGIMTYSAFKGIGLTDVLNGVSGSTLDPKGGTVANGLTTDVGAIPAGATPVGPYGNGSLSGGGSMEAEMDRMIACDQPYVYGGGHRDFSPNGPWDCSGAMSWLMHYMGFLTTNGPITSTGFMSQGVAGRGNDFTIYANPVHVFLIMEQGPRKGQAWGTTSRLKSAGGSLAWHNHTTAGFVARHYYGH